MENRQMKCIKGESCLYCGSTYCRFVDELYQLKQTLTEIKEITERCGKRIPLFEIDEIAEDLKQILQKISEVENERKENCN